MHRCQSLYAITIDVDVSRRHRCPHKPYTKNEGATCFLTEYGTKFPKHQNESRRSIIRPFEKSLINKDAKMEDDTTNKINFVAHPIGPLFKRLPEKYRSPQGVIDSTSEYKNKYQGEWTLPVQAILPPVTKKDLGKFDPSTTNSRDFVTKPFQPLSSFKPGNMYQPPKETFGCLSTAHTDFLDNGQVSKTPMMKPYSKSVASDEPFNDVSSYNTNYTVPPIPDRFVHPKQKYVPSNKEFSSSTTNKSDFCKFPPTDCPKTIKPPENKFYDKNIPFEKNTTNRQHYKPWELPSRFSKPPAVYSPPTEKLSTVTTCKLDYPHHGYSPPSPNFKPEHQPSNLGPLDGRTTSVSDYKPWNGVGRPPLIIHDKPYESPKSKFDGISTFKAHYLGNPEPRAPMAKPQQTPLSSSEKMQSLTSYRDDYAGGHKICPAALLSDETTNKDFLYSHADNSGHKLYKPIMSST